MSNKPKGILGSSEGVGKTVNIGHGSYLMVSRIVSIMESGSLPMKRLRETAAEDHKLIDVTAGRKTRSLILTDCGFIVLSALAPGTLHERLFEGPSWLSPAQLEVEEGVFAS